VIKNIARRYPNAPIHACSSKQHSLKTSNVKEYQVNYMDEQSLSLAKEQIASTSKTVDLIFVATGMLHNKDIISRGFFSKTVLMKCCNALFLMAL
jgi:hypothetical protein